MDDATLKVDIDLSATILAGDAEVDLDFELHFEITCDPDAGTATLRVRTRNFAANLDINYLDDLDHVGHY